MALPSILRLHLARRISFHLSVRSYNGLGIGASDNGASFPKPEQISGVGDGKAYGFPQNKNLGPEWFFPDDRVIYYRKQRPYWKAWPIGTVVYFYLFWNWYKNFEEITGSSEFHPPNPDLFTDEELGIPPDDVPGYGLLEESE